MRQVMELIAALTLSVVAPAAQAAEPVSFPDYQEVDGLNRYATEAEYRTAVADKKFVLERIAYQSDALEVFAYVYRPAAQSEKLPVIIFNRGSWTWPSFHAEMVTMANRFARAGYLVVAPMYRGSGGAKGRDELGGADLADLFNVLPAIRAFPYADASRIYLYGESRGGMMTYQALRDGFPARAAAVVGAFTDLDAMLADPQWGKVGLVVWPELKTDRARIVERRSAQRWAEKINVPLLIIHGAKDPQVKVAQSLGLVQKLDALGKAYELHIVEGGSHTLDNRHIERDRWVTEWFARH